MQSCLVNGGQCVARLLLTAAAVTCSFLSPTSAQSVIYVDADAVGSTDGTSWDDAFLYLQDALAHASEGDQIWIAEGTYRPDQGAGVTPGDRDTSFVLGPLVHILGGFIGNESNLAQRDWHLHPVILSGDLLGNDTDAVPGSTPERSENAQHVLIAGPGTANSRPVLDGVIVQGGQAVSAYTSGAGLRHHPGGEAGVEIRNSLFRRNFAVSCGGGVAVFGTLVVRDSRFENNVSDRGCGIGGGAIAIQTNDELDVADRKVTIRGSVFRGNVTNEEWCGGAVAIRDGPAEIVNSVFVDNMAVEGGAICLTDIASPEGAVIANVTMRGNVATQAGGGAVSVDDSNVTIVNGLIHNNTATDGGNPSGGAIVCYDPSSSLSISLTTFAANEADGPSVVASSPSCPVEISNSIIWDNPSASGESLGPLGTTADILVRHSIVSGTLGSGVATGDGFFVADPVFADADGSNDIPGDADDDYRLASASPAIDAGLNDLILNDATDLDHDGDIAEPVPLDLDGNERVVRGSTLSEIVDMGAFENVDFVSSVDRQKSTLHVCSVRAFPNPASSYVNVSVDLSESSLLLLRVTDILGRLRLSTSWQHVTPEPQQRLLSIGMLPAGIYLLSVRATRGSTACDMPILVRH